MNLQRMIVIPSHTFEKWKNIVIHDQKLSDLDKNMKLILNNTKLNDFTKWQLYRQNLIKFTNSARMFNKSTKSKLQSANNNKRLMDVSTETRRIIKREKGVGTDIAVKDEETDTADIPDQFIPVKGRKQAKVSPNKTMEDIFQTSNKFTSLDEDVFDNNISDNDKNYTLDQDDTITRRALENQSQNVKIVRERKSMNPAEYRAFELSNGEEVNVPVEKRIRLTRSRAKNQKTQFNLPPNPTNKQARSSTPSKKKKQGGAGIGNSLIKSIPWIVYK
jgi:hypothetical protein